MGRCYRLRSCCNVDTRRQTVSTTETENTFAKKRDLCVGKRITQEREVG